MQPFNLVIIEGNVVSKPNLKKSTNGKFYSYFPVASNHFYKANDAWVNEPTFINIQCWGHLAQIVADTCDKGEKIIVYGKLRLYSKPTETGKQDFLYLVANKIERFSNGEKNSIEENQDSVDIDDQIITIEEEVPA